MHPLRKAALTALLLTLPALAVAAPPASATPVLILKGQRVIRRDERYLPGVDLAPLPSARVAATLERRVRPRSGRQSPPTERALARLLAAGSITRAQYADELDAYRGALRTERRLRGTRRDELAGVVANVDQIAAEGALTPDRLAPVFMTLARNVQWWTTASVPAPGARVGFAGSQLVWEYYPGQGIELQMLGSFGKANGLWSAHRDGELRSLLGELVPLAAERRGAPAWEYYFDFDGGVPPWTSSISQGTAIQALGRASKRLHDPSLGALAERALGVFQHAPPAGVRVPTAHGAEYVIYSFAPRTFVLNAFLQAVIGLHDFAHITGDPTATALFAEGDAEARVAVPRYDTGAWSLYSPGIESDLSYHELVTGFLKRLCSDTHAPIYCMTAQRFASYLHAAPLLTPLTTRVRSGAPARLAFGLDKISSVTVTVRHGARVVFAASETLGHGRRYVVWPKPARAGSYELSVSATDLAGNRAEASRPLRVLPARRRPRRGRSGA